MVKKNTSTNRKVVAIGATALLATGIGGYGIGVATHQYAGDFPEDYAITSSERDSALKTLASLTTKSSSTAIPEYNRDAVFSGWKDSRGNLDAQKWIEYANDIDNLLPTASSTNESKGNKNIADWQPANTNFLCTFAIKQI